MGFKDFSTSFNCEVLMALREPSCNVLGVIGMPKFALPTRISPDDAKLWSDVRFIIGAGCVASEKVTLDSSEVAKCDAEPMKFNAWDGLICKRSDAANIKTKAKP
ncbi:MAG: hypothetical protein ACREBF_02065 [Candidatus Micrarchaeales archaeon]